MFFKRRSRANSYIEETPQRSQSYDAQEHEQRPESSRKSQQQQRPATVASPTDDNDMYPRPQAPQDAYPPRGLSNGHNTAAVPNMAQSNPQLTSGKIEPMPDMLAQAFNQAIRPYSERIEELESQLADAQRWVEQLEQQRAEVHSWIDKRGLRPGTLLRCTLLSSAQANNAQTSRPLSQRSWTTPPPTPPSPSTHSLTARSP